MDKNKLKELITQCISEILQEDGVGGNVSANAGGYLGKFAFKKPIKQKPINEVRYSQFKTQTKTRTPQEQLHMGVKEIQRKLDEINKLVEFATRMKTELKGDAEEMNFLKRTHNSLFKINEKIQSINNKIKDLTE
jgi:hypothetical protein